MIVREVQCIDSVGAKGERRTRGRAGIGMNVATECKEGNEERKMER